MSQPQKQIRVDDLPSSQLRHEIDQKNLTKAARKAALVEIQNYYDKLRAICIYPEHLLFLDEISKDGRDALRRCDRSKNGTREVVRVPFNRENRVSVFEALDYNIFMSCTSIECT